MCFAPVLTMSGRRITRRQGAQCYVASAASTSRRPRRASRTQSGAQAGARRGADTEEVLEQSGFSAAEIAELKKDSIIGAAA